MQKQIEEVMALVDALAKDCIAAGIAKMAGSESVREQIAGDVRKCRSDVEAKMRELLPVWQPIESAPKDQTIAVIPPTWKSRGCSTAKYEDDRYAAKPRPYWRRDDALGKTSISRDVPPTHWMPLPKAPE